MSRDADIAVIGMAGKYPKADSPRELWHNLVAGIDMSDDGGTGPDGRVRRHFPVDGIDLFDHAFFGFTPFASQIMDPQHRILLTCAYRAMEDAGYERIPRGVRVGVFASASLSTYLINVVLRSPYFDAQGDNYQLLLGNDKDTLATRIAYKLNLTGPAMSIQCACSSSLVALHHACQSLLAGDCDICLVGAVSITVPQDGGYQHKEGGIFSRDGYCRAFDKAATGTVKGNGCSVVVLRPLKDAERASDRIQAVIRGTAVNNDGSDKMGFTAPAVGGQRSVIEEALSFAGVAGDDVDYIETHGTGTDLGDQIELTALAAAFDGSGEKIPLGSLKASIGHLDVAAGLTSVIKSVSVLQHGLVPAIAHLRDPTDAVKAATARFEFPREASRRKLNVVGVSSFGIGGTNAHAVVARHEPKARAARRHLPYYLVPIYLNRAEDAADYSDNILAQLRSGTSLLDLAATLATRRKRRALVRCAVARTAEELISAFKGPWEPADSTNLSLPRFSIAELEELATALPCVSLSREEHRYSGPLGVAQSLCQVLVRLGVFAIRPLVESNGVATETHQEDGQSVVRQSAPLLCRDSEELSDPSTPAIARLLEFLARVHTRFELDLTELYRGTNWTPTSLPAYPLHQVRHWIAGVESQTPAEADESQPAAKTVRHDEALLEEILAIWKAGIGEEDINEDTSFSETNADSLMAIDVIARVNQTYGCKIGVTASLASLTPQSIASLILGREYRSSAPWISSVRYRSAQAKNIFLVHPAGGSTFCYSSLGRHVTENVNLCAIDLPEGYEGYGSLRALAERYATAIRGHQPKGPYRVGGYSFGGNLAHELARVLEQTGSEVEAAYMFDSHPPQAYNTYDGSELDYVGAFPTLVASYFKPDLIESATRESEGVKDWTVAVEIVRRLGILKGSISNDDAERFFRRWVFSHTLLKQHEPSARVEAPLTVFVAQEDESPLLLDKLRIKSVSKLSWESYFVNPVTAIAVDGDHFTMFSVSRHLKTLAKRFDAALQAREEIEPRLPIAQPQMPA